LTIILIQYQDCGMIICVCKAVSDRSIRRSVEQGEIVALRDLTRETGLGTCCGKCVPAAREVLQGALAAQAARADRPMGLPAFAAGMGAASC
jgi:bacterioferritin-associated ferredoxin